MPTPRRPVVSWSTRRAALACALPILLLVVGRAAAAVPPEAIAAADAWVERAVAHGLPDARDGTLLAGTLRVRVRIPPNDRRPLWESWWPLEIDAVGDDGGRHMRLHLDGVHLRLVDGSWLAGCECRVPIQDGVEVDASGLHPIAMAAATAGLPTWQVASTALSLHQRDAVELHLWRLGAPGREERALRAYLSSPWQPLLQARALVTGADVAARWGGYVTDDDLSQRPADLLPRLLRDRAFIWFADRACDGNAMPRERAAAAALEFAPPALREELTRYFAAVAAAAAVPAWRAGGDLDALLQGWNDGDPPDPTLLDPDALARALSDPRPSRWIESGQPRLVGDNALRALAHRLGRDPRLLAGLDAGEPWTAAVRARTMPILQAWWLDHRTTPVDRLVVPTVAASSLPTQLQLVHRLPVAERPPVLAAIAAGWSVNDPFADPPAKAPTTFGLPEPSPGTLARGHRQTLDHLLALDGPQRVLLAALDRLPDRPASRLPRALAHDLHGDPRPLDALLATMLAGDGDDDEGAEILTAVSFRPSPTRLDALRAALSGKTVRWPLVVGVLVLQCHRHAPVQVHQDRADRRAGLALALGLALTALDDQSVVDAWVEVKGPVYSDWRFGPEVGSRGLPFTGGLPGATQASALSAQGGLRLCDLVAYALYEWARFADELQPAGCDTAAAPAARDATIAGLRPRVTAACAAEWKRIGEGR